MKKFIIAELFFDPTILAPPYLVSQKGREGGGGQTYGIPLMVENLKFRPQKVDFKISAKVIPLVYLSPLLTVMKELVWIVLYFLVNILKIDP